MFSTSGSQHRTSLFSSPSLTTRRWICRAESQSSDSTPFMDDNGSKTLPPDSKTPSVLTRRFRKTTKKLKKSKNMQALAASLASKTRNPAPILMTSPITPSQSVSSPTSDANEQLNIPNNVIEPLEPYINDPDDLCVLPKPIYIISDCTGSSLNPVIVWIDMGIGESAARTVRAALGQFESNIKAHCPTTLLLHRFVSEPKHIATIVTEAAKEDGLVVFTLVDPVLVKATQTACAVFEVNCVDLWSELLDIMEGHLNAIRSVIPAKIDDQGRRRTLDPEYFRRIEAVEFTRKMDDGAFPDQWNDADILLLGVSRSGKTPLAIYLGQLGFKVANLPLVKGIELPPQLNEIDPSKVFGLIIDPRHLFKIRRSRMGSMGVGNSPSMYAELKGVIEELDYAKSVYQSHPDWPVLDVTDSGVEETATRIQRIISSRGGYLERVIYA